MRDHEEVRNQFKSQQLLGAQAHDGSRGTGNGTPEAVSLSLQRESTSKTSGLFPPFLLPCMLFS